MGIKSEKMIKMNEMNEIKEETTMEKKTNLANKIVNELMELAIGVICVTAIVGIAVRLMTIWDLPDAFGYASFGLSAYATIKLGNIIERHNWTIGNLNLFRKVKERRIKKEFEKEERIKTVVLETMKEYLEQNGL